MTISDLIDPYEYICTCHVPLAVGNFGKLLDKMHLAKLTLANLWLPWIKNVNIMVFIVDSIILIYQHVS